MELRISKDISEVQFENLRESFNQLAMSEEAQVIELKHQLIYLKYFFELKNKTQIKLAGNSSFIFKENNINHSREIC